MQAKAHATIPSDILLRKGARKAADIPEHVRNLLQSGQIESVNLTEWLAVDHILLFQQITQDWEMIEDTLEIIQQLQQLNEQRIMKLIPAIALAWLALMEHKDTEYRTQLFYSIAQHHSDSVRCWAAYMIGMNSQLSLNEKLDRIRPFAADPHFGVREIAWMAVREPIIIELPIALKHLLPWTADPDPRIRRFAIESIRPHGVWAKHIQVLKENPALALPLLELVKSDQDKYVQDSVSNWLNDASKSNPDWVRQVCSTWLQMSDTKATRRITTRAQRSL
ncbi:DNA alkylation repair protein [Paenibacillus sp. 7516]|uniref:DNA alkylation repair protein n=1 Tax=Paenibacillus sp. 7516 TaxID=2022549 RepID=UPI002015F92F|nr:DNA alkylation repair protein [Paenibacillus sp. 7516]